MTEEDKKQDGFRMADVPSGGVPAVCRADWAAASLHCIEPVGHRRVGIRPGNALCRNKRSSFPTKQETIHDNNIMHSFGGHPQLLGNTCPDRRTTAVSAGNVASAASAAQSGAPPLISLTTVFRIPQPMMQAQRVKSVMRKDDIDGELEILDASNHDWRKVYYGNEQNNMKCKRCGQVAWKMRICVPTTNRLMIPPVILEDSEPHVSVTTQHRFDDSGHCVRCHIPRCELVDCTVHDTRSARLKRDIDRIVAEQASLPAAVPAFDLFTSDDDDLVMTALSKLSQNEQATQESPAIKQDKKEKKMKRKEKRDKENHKKSKKESKKNKE